MSVYLDRMLRKFPSITSGVTTKVRDLALKTITVCKSIQYYNFILALYHERRHNHISIYGLFKVNQEKWFPDSDH